MGLPHLLKCPLTAWQHKKQKARASASEGLTKFYGLRRGSGVLRLRDGRRQWQL